MCRIGMLEAKANRDREKRWSSEMCMCVREAAAVVVGHKVVEPG